MRIRAAASGSTGTRNLPVFYFNGSRYGDTSSLQSLRTSDIAEIRFIDARDATTRFGSGVTGGVIAIESKR